jgi:hypothetical protein
MEIRLQLAEVDALQLLAALMEPRLHPHPECRFVG